MPVVGLRRCRSGQLVHVKWAIRGPAQRGQVVQLPPKNRGTHLLGVSFCWLMTPRRIEFSTAKRFMFRQTNGTSNALLYKKSL